MNKRIRIVVKGRVQGVFFRDFTRKKAQSLGLLGTVRNLRDGSVEIMAQGDPATLKTMEKWCWQGSPMSQVIVVDVKELEDAQSYPDFRVIY